MVNGLNQKTTSGSVVLSSDGALDQSGTGKLRVFEMGRMKLGYWICPIVLLTGCTTTPSTTKSNFPAFFSLPAPSGRVSSFTSARKAGLPLLSWPVSGQILSGFGDLKNDVTNKGIDIQAPAGTAIKAALDGKVSFVSDQVKGYGNMIIVDHSNGFQTVYAHNAENLVAVGQHVAKGQTIGKVGSTGRASSAFLHFEIRRNHRPVNPLQYLTNG